MKAVIYIVCHFNLEICRLKITVSFLLNNLHNSSDRFVLYLALYSICAYSICLLFLADLPIKVIRQLCPCKDTTCLLIAARPLTSTIPSASDFIREGRLLHETRKDHFNNSLAKSNKTQFSKKSITQYTLIRRT